MSGLAPAWQGAPRTPKTPPSPRVPDSPLSGCPPYAAPPDGTPPQGAAAAVFAARAVGSRERRGGSLIELVVSAVRGAGGLCVAVATGSVLLLLLALLLLPHLTATGVQWTAVAVVNRAAGNASTTADPAAGAAAKQSRMAFRWPLQGIPGVKAKARAIGGSSGGGDPAAGSTAYGTSQGGVPCAKGCEQRGNCNRDSGRCECPFGRTGLACEVGALPACRLQDSDDALMACPFESEPWRVVACACHRQCEAYLEGLGPDLDFPEPLQDPGAAPCFERKTLPPERQTSDFPAAGELGMTYRRGSLDGSPEVQREEVAVRDGREQLPLGLCPGSCSFAGACLRAAASAEPPACHCLGRLTGPDCSGREDEGGVFDMCPANCSGVGVCRLGYCRCPPGRWGVDCSRSKAWAPQRQQPASRLRIYVYDLPFTLVQMHAARHLHDIGIYLAYLAFYRTLLADLGGARTQNPYEANMFLIPAQTFQWSDNLGFVRGHHLRVVQWVRQHLPFWNASGGADHLLWWPNDQGVAYSHHNEFPPGESPADYVLLEAPVKATHFCYSGAGGDDSSARNKYGNYGQHPWPPGYAFEPTRDVCAAPSNFEVDLVAECQATYAGIPQDDAALRADPEHLPLGDRSTLLFFLGSTPANVTTEADLPDPQFSAGARQALMEAHNSTPGFRISNGSELDPPLRDAAAEERDALFCFAPTGHGFGMRLVDAVSHGCIPVIVQDDVVQYFEDILPYGAFSVRVPQCDIPRLHAILSTIPRRELALLQWGLVDYHRAFVWQRPYGLAYNYTIASLERSLASRRSAATLFPHTSWQSWLRQGGGAAEPGVT